MTSRTLKTKLDPVTITITDQAALKRLHKVAGRSYVKPHQMAKQAFNGGLWHCLRPVKEIDTRAGGAA